MSIPVATPLRQLDAANVLATVPLGEAGGILFPSDNDDNFDLTELVVEQELSTTAAAAASSSSAPPSAAAINFQQCGGVIYPKARLPKYPAATLHCKDRVSLWGRLERTFPQVLQARRFLSTYVPPLNYVLPLPPSETQRTSRDIEKLPLRVVAAAAHPHAMKMAIALRIAGTGVHIHTYDLVSGKWESPLRHAKMQEVGTMQWKHGSESILMVGTPAGVFMWAPSLKLPDAGTAGICCIYPFDPSCNPLVDTLALSSSGQFMSAGSSQSHKVCFYDLAKEPNNARIMVSPSMNGGTSCLAFTACNRFVLRGFSETNRLNLVDTQSWTSTSKVMGAPVEAVVPCWERAHNALYEAMGTGSSAVRNVFAVQMRGVEGLMLVRVNAAEAGVEVILKITTGLGSPQPGIGGLVRQVVVMRQRMYVLLESNHVLVAYIGALPTELARGESDVYIRAVGTFKVGPNLRLAAVEGFAKGSMVALVGLDAQTSFIPTYST